MQLNIYIISHPIIEIMMNKIIYSQSNNIQKYYKKIGLLMVYEVLRKWMKIQTIYIKQINQIKELCILNTKESYVIITNLVESYPMITDIDDLLPSINIQHINQPIDPIKLQNSYILQKINNTSKILIFELFLNNYEIIKLLNYLLLKKNIKTSQIKILCITCNHKILEKLGQMHPKLNIYTTKIITNE
uniref:Uracil phosphoribosyltransferase n=1 Tax=Schimmelmannia schousboei TaxID=173468 RepID=A0A1C9C8W6_9FLOR|nr:uracil phosphoribosyltransferase [Schimmelmannia schousboei]AOM64820.1 uracil phosphoribosyltransferase [Schimmelmannia schousboei]